MNYAVYTGVFTGINGKSYSYNGGNPKWKGQKLLISKLAFKGIFYSKPTARAVTVALYE